MMDFQWVHSLSEREDLSEFGRLQDHIGENLIPRFAALLGESPKSLLDVLAYAELFLGSRLTAISATQLLMDVVGNISLHAEAIRLNDYSSNKPKSDRFEGIPQ